MVSIHSNSFLLLATSIFVSSSFSRYSYGADSQFHRLQTIHIEGMTELGQHGVVLFESWRSVLERANAASDGNPSLILAAKRTKRIDPLQNFKHYKGGWNISNKHYLASVGFTAAPLFIICGLWFVGFGLHLFIISFRHCRRQTQNYGYSRKSNALSLGFLVIFTIATIVGCVVLYTGQGKFHSSTRNTLDYVVLQADDTVVHLKNVSHYLSAAKQIQVFQFSMPPNVQSNIDHIKTKINATSTFLEDQTKNKSDGIKHVLDSVKIALLIIAAVMLLLAFTGFLCSVLDLQFLVYILAIIGWILVSGTFILCGIFLLLHNVAADTCVAMNEWVQNPTAHTALDDILPCVDNTTAQETLLQSKEVTFQLVNMINHFITNVSNKDLPPQAGPLFYNQTGPLVPVLCNPYQPNKTKHECESGEVHFSNATEEWKNYICEVSAADICTTPGRLTPNYYNQMTATINVSIALYHYGPFLVDLQDCSFVRKTFTDINDIHCPGLRLYSAWIYIGLTIVSSAVLLSQIFWLVYKRQRRNKEYTIKCADMASQDSIQGQKGM